MGYLSAGSEDVALKMAIRLPGFLSILFVAALLLNACLPGTPGAGGGKPSELKIAMVDFMSGGAAKFGTAALNAGELTFDQINAQGGIGGVKVNYQKLDEAGPVDQVVTNYRR